MHGLSESDALRLWETGSNRHPVDRVTLLIAWMWPELTDDQLNEMTVGQRNRCLLDLCRNVNGPELDGYAECPRCNEPLQFSLTVNELLETHSGDDPVDVQWEGHSLRFRMPNALDLAAVAVCKNIDSGRDQLIDRCLVESESAGRGVPHHDLPDGAIESASEALREQDPLMEMRCELECIACHHHWEVFVDALPFVWAEVTRRAGGLLRQVHQLATAYGWSESEILGMDESRRLAYLEMQ